MTALKESLTYDGQQTADVLLVLSHIVVMDVCYANIKISPEMFP